MTLSRITCLISLVVAVGCAGAAAPDTVITNGKIFTANPAQPWAQALAIRGDRIVAVGVTLIEFGDAMQDPEGGRLGRDEHGRWNGRLEEYAIALAQRRMGVKIVHDAGAIH